MPVMYNAYKVTIVFLSVLFFVPAQGHVPLIGPTSESYTQKSHIVGRKLEREFYIRAATLTVSGVVCATVLVNWAVGLDVSKPTPPSDVRGSWAPSTQDLKNVAIWLSKACAQGICMQFITSHIMTNNAEPQNYIGRYIQYKIHCIDIDRLLLDRAADEYLHNDCGHVYLLIQGHLQALVDKIELLMAYMVYYGAAHTQPQTYAHIEKYAAEVIKKVGNIVEQFNTTQAVNSVDAIHVCKKECSDLLIFSVRYALSVLPCDD